MKRKKMCIALWEILADELKKKVFGFMIFYE